MHNAKKMRPRPLLGRPVDVATGLLLSIILILAAPFFVVHTRPAEDRGQDPPSQREPLVGIPLPNERQLDFMEMELVQFMHFGTPTFWSPPPAFLRGPNPTYHDCINTGIDRSSNQTGPLYHPCLNPDIFQPTDLNADSWMEAASAMGVKEICLTAKHVGGFALWPSKYTNNSVASSSWRNGTGDVLREFVDAARRWNMSICYYANPRADGYLWLVEKVDGPEFVRRQVGMLEELLVNYGPINRLWFDGTHAAPPDVDYDDLWQRVFRLVRSTSPSTIIGPYRGDVCTSTGSLYNWDGPNPNSTDYSVCGPKGATETGKYFHPTEMHGVTIQQGPDGNTPGELPTFWFWHDWACPDNRTGCPWIGNLNASNVFEAYLRTVGHGATLNVNIPPTRSGRVDGTVAQVMRDVGSAINDTFGGRNYVSRTVDVTGPCKPGVAVLDDVGGEPFDYVVTMEDLRLGGQRIVDYSVDFRRVGSQVWETLIPRVVDRSSSSPSKRGGSPLSGRRISGDDNGSTSSSSSISSTDLRLDLRDRPDGFDPRDSYVGHKRIDFPTVPTGGGGGERDPSAAAANNRVAVEEVRFNCHRALAEPVFVRSFALHRRAVPWEMEV